MTDTLFFSKLAGMEKVAFVISSQSKHKATCYRDLNDFIKGNNYYQIEVKETSRSRGAISIAQDFASSGFNYVVAVGGDGTVNEVVNGIILANKPGVRLGVLPYGTANDFCKTVQCPKSIAELFESINQHSFQYVKMGRIDFKDGEGNSQTRYFINIADLGIGADVVKRVNRSRKRLGADLTFMKAILRTFLTYKNKHIIAQAGDWEWQGKINSLVIANGKYFGSGLCIAPNAAPSSDQFEVVISGDISIIDYLRNVGKIKKGQLIDHAKVFYKTAKNLTVDGVGQPCAIESDGEFLGFTPVSVSVADMKIAVVNII